LDHNSPHTTNATQSINWAFQVKNLYAELKIDKGKASRKEAIVPDQKTQLEKAVEHFRKRG